MANPRELYAASFGGVRLWCSQVATTNSRKVVIHSPTSGDDHVLQDRGLELRVTTCTLIFDDMDGETSTPKQRFDRFAELVERGEPQVFTHPLRGSYRARVGRFDHSVDEASVITADVEFLPDELVPAVVTVDTGATAIAGGDSVTAAADQADLELQRVGMSSDVTEEARAAAESWEEDDSTARRVIVDVGTLTEKVGTEVERLGLSASLKLWRAHRAMLLLSDTVVAAGRSATADVSRIMVVRIARPVALRALLATIYGARDVDVRERQARSLNDIRTAGWIETGTELRLPLPSVAPRRG